jgi:hypothetical protein
MNTRIAQRAVLLLLAAGLGALQAQQADIRAWLRFEPDTAAIGWPVTLRLSVQHAPGVKVTFLRRQEDLRPMELIEAGEAERRTENGLVLETIRFRVRTFDLSPKQWVRAPFIYVAGRDTVRMVAESDTLYLQRRLAPDQTGGDFLAAEGVLPVRVPPDYGLLFTLLILLGGGVAAVLVALRRPIARYLRLRRNRQEWLQMRRKLKELEQAPIDTGLFETINRFWKQILDPQDQWALGSMTTTEIRQRIASLGGLDADQQRSFIQAAEAGDQVLYAGLSLDRGQLLMLLWELTQALDRIFEARERQLQEAA